MVWERCSWTGISRLAELEFKLRQVELGGYSFKFATSQHRNIATSLQHRELELKNFGEP